MGMIHKGSDAGLTESELNSEWYEREQKLKKKLKKLEEYTTLLERKHASACEKVSAYLQTHDIGMVGDNIFDIILDEAGSLRELSKQAVEILRDYPDALMNCICHANCSNHLPAVVNLRRGFERVLEKGGSGEKVGTVSKEDS
jgi:hypothetical protein